MGNPHILLKKHKVPTTRSLVAKKNRLTLKSCCAIHVLNTQNSKFFFKNPQKKPTKIHTRHFCSNFVSLFTYTLVHGYFRILCSYCQVAIFYECNLFVEC